MSTIQRTAAAVIAAAAFSGAALAAPATAAFTYTPGAPASEIYAEFQSSAKRACVSYEKDISTRLAAQAACEADLLGKAVKALGSAEVAALHRGETWQTRALAAVDAE